MAITGRTPSPERARAARATAGFDTTGDDTFGQDASDLDAADEDASNLGAADEDVSALDAADEDEDAELEAGHAPHTLSRPKPASPPEVGRRIALLAAAAGLDKKAEDIQIIDVIGKVDYADYIVLMTGASDRNVAAIARGIEADLAKESVRALALEGLPLARWVLIDFVEVVVHVFQAEWREVYDLDGLWMDAARIPLPPAAKSSD